MANEMEKGSYNVGLLCSLFGQFINLIISNDVCVASDFAYCDIVLRSLAYILFGL
jgi:hypothetical protein